MKKEYLTEEEQYKDILNIDEISRIRDPELREIRMKYWQMQHTAFLDEHNISDCEIAMVSERIKKEEAAEISLYRKNKGIE